MSDSRRTPSATPRRLARTLAAGWALLVTLPSAAADPLAALRGCARLGDDAERLACYDRAMASAASPSVPAAPVAAPTSAAAATAATAPVLTGEQAFGLPSQVVMRQEAERAGRAPDLATVEAQVIALGSNGGRMVFTLDNGQEWRQYEITDDLLVKVGDRVVLSRGAFGSYWLKAPSGRTTKVARTR